MKGSDFSSPRKTEFEVTVQNERLTLLKFKASRFHGETSLGHLNPRKLEAENDDQTSLGEPSLWRSLFVPGLEALETVQW